MGAFYGSIQIRRADREQVRQAVEQVAQEKGIRCLMGPLLSGWIGVYPEQSGQDQRVGEAIAMRLPGDVLHLLVHDDDVMAYWLWRDGKTVHTYCSTPGYFDEDARETEQAMTGRPEVFPDLSPEQIASLHRMLDREAMSVESERLQAFADTLGIANAATSYEYLKEGERQGIRGWKHFEELPAMQVASARKAGQERRRRINAIKKRYRGAGLLLNETVGKQLMVRSCAFGEGMAVAWSGFGADKNRLEHHTPPWQQPTAIPVDLAPQVNSVASDAQGRLLAATLGTRVVVWESELGRVLQEIPEANWAVDVALSADGRLLAHTSRSTVVVREVRHDEPVKTLPPEAHSHLRFHPSGRWLVAVLDQHALGIAELEQPGAGPWRTLWAGQPHEPYSDEAVERFQHRIAEAAMKQFEQESGQDLQKLPEEEAARIMDQITEQVRKHVEEQLRSLRGTLGEMFVGAPATPDPGDQLMSLAFTRDGRWLCAGTDQGLRVYAWEAVLTVQGDTLPEPTWRFDVQAGEEQSPADGYIHAIAPEADGAGVFFGGAEGRLYRMDLQTGKVRPLLSMPEEGAISQLVLSRGGQTLGTVSHSSIGHTRQDNMRNFWNVWSCAGLKTRGTGIG